jgi:hypothetical protein
MKWCAAVPEPSKTQRMKRFARNSDAAHSSSDVVTLAFAAAGLFNIVLQKKRTIEETS